MSGVSCSFIIVFFCSFILVFFSFFFVAIFFMEGGNMCPRYYLSIYYFFHYSLERLCAISFRGQ